MAKIYRLSDKISYKIGDVEVKISPLSLQDKQTLHEYMIKGQIGDSKALLEGSMFAIKASVKSISGLEDLDGNEYKLEFDGKYLTDECISDLMNLQESNKLIALCSQLIAGVPLNPPEGVTLVPQDPKK